MRGSKKIIIAVIAVLVAAAITVTILLIVKGRSTSTDDTTKVTYAKSATIIDEFTTEASQPSFNEGKYTVTPVSTESKQPMYIYDTDLEKFVSVETNYSAMLTPTSGLTIEELGTTNTNTTNFFKERGLSTKLNAYDDTILVAQSSENVTCQAQTISAAKTVVRIVVSCVDTSSIKDQLSEIKTLIGLWPTAKSTKYDSITESTLTKGAYKVAIVAVTTTDLSSSHSLVYVKSGDTWKYIGDASEGTAVVSNERYVVNKDIKAGLDNDQYGDAISEALLKL